MNSTLSLQMKKWEFTGLMSKSNEICKARAWAQDLWSSPVGKTAMVVAPQNCPWAADAGGPDSACTAKCQGSATYMKLSGNTT